LTPSTRVLVQYEAPRTLIANVNAVLPDGGALIVYGAIIDVERRQNVFGLPMNLNMLIEMPGGCDYTGADCMAWMRAAGFRETRVGPDAMVTGFK
jgi:hypothetical protein